MTIHYHGLPLTPEVMLLDLAGKHVCISFATVRQKQLDTSLRVMQSIMFDNGAFSAHQQGGELDIDAYYAWLLPILRHPHWAVVPDVIDGTVDQQREMVATWPYSKALGAPVWHLGLPLEYLEELVSTWPRVCLGSSGAYWHVGSPSWRGRMREAETIISRSDCHIHGLRMMAEAGKWSFLASVDSVNVARNYKDRDEMPGRMADRLDRVNAPLSPIKPSTHDLGDLLNVFA